MSSDVVDNKTTIRPEKRTGDIFVILMCILILICGFAPISIIILHFGFRAL